MKYILYIEDHTGTAELEFDSLKDARAELTTRLSFAYSNGSNFDKKNQDDYTVSNYWQGPTHLYIKRMKETTKNKSSEQSLHIAIYIGKFKIYRVFKSCEALHNYVQSILNKGYTAFGTEYNGKTEKLEKFKTTDWNTMCSEIFEYGLILRKTTTNGKQLEVKIYNHEPKMKMKTKEPAKKKDEKVTVNAEIFKHPYKWNVKITYGSYEDFRALHKNTKDGIVDIPGSFKNSMNSSSKAPLIIPAINSSKNPKECYGIMRYPWEGEMADTDLFDPYLKKGLYPLKIDFDGKTYIARYNEKTRKNNYQLTDHWRY